MSDTAAPRRLAKKVLLIGWDAADWKVITPLLDAGKMPALESLINRGVMGNLATLDPPFSPMLWTSVATGKTADQHGILGFVEPQPDGSGIRPILNTSRTCKAIWNILHQEGMRSNVIGWWPSHPVEPIRGTMVSNFYQNAKGPVTGDWPLMPGAIHPPELADVLAELRVHPNELTRAHLLPFVPEASSADFEKEQKRFRALLKVIADASSIQAAATYVLEHTEWNLTAVYFDAIDHFGHGFMKYHPPIRPGIPREQFRLYSGVIEAGYRFHDMLLERLLNLVDDDTTVLLISDHGFHADHLRPLGLPDEPAAPAYEHRDYGIVVMAGPGIGVDERVAGASLLDITPTLLTLFGLPIGRDMAGKPLITAFAEPPALHYIDSWESRPGPAGQHDPDTTSNAAIEAEAMKQLIELGYIDPPSPKVQDTVKRTERELQFHLARVYLSTNRPTQALPILESLHNEWPDDHRFLRRLTNCLLQLNQGERARSTVVRLRDVVKKEAAASLAKKQAELNASASTDKPASAPATNPSSEVRPSEAPALQTPGLDLLEATVLIACNEPEAALTLLRRSEKASPHRPTLHIRLGDAFARLKTWDEAERAFRRALVIDPVNAAAHHGLGKALLRQQRYMESVDSVLRAVSLRYYFPAAHYHLGEALARLDRHERAAQAFEVAVSQAPGMRKAHRWLAELYRTRLDDTARAAYHLALADPALRPMPGA